MDTIDSSQFLSDSDFTENQISQKLKPKPSIAEKKVKKLLKSNKKKSLKQKETLRSTQRRLEKYEEILLATGDNNKAKVVLEETLNELDDPDLKQFVEEKDTIWKPNSQPQIDFLSATEDEVLASGSRGSGKSSPLIIDPLRYCDNPNFRGLVIRRTMPELRELIGRAKTVYAKAFPGSKWREQEKLFVFPSGAKIEFGYCDSEDDVLRYQGQEYQWIGVDEITQFKDETLIEKLLSSLRSTDPTLPNHFRATTNPSGPGTAWVKKRFIDQGPSNTTIRIANEVEIDGITTEYVVTRKWIHSTIFDNKDLMKTNPQYVAKLASLEDNLKKQWLYGSWDTVDGLAFNDFARRKDKIICEPFSVPQNWQRIRAADWGYSSPAVCLWLAFDPEGTVYVYRELAVNAKRAKQEDRVDAKTFAEMVLRLEAPEYVRYGVLDSSTWSNRGESSPSIADTMMYHGCQWTPSDRSPGSRVNSKMLLHSYFKDDEFTQKPKLKIFNTCQSLINCLSTLEVDKHNSEDVNTDMDDHAYDALRYGLSSRPHYAHSSPTQFRHFISESKPVVINNMFGY